MKSYYFFISDKACIALWSVQFYGRVLRVRCEPTNKIICKNQSELPVLLVTVCRVIKIHLFREKMKNIIISSEKSKLSLGFVNKIVLVGVFFYFYVFCLCFVAWFIIFVQPSMMQMRIVLTGSTCGDAKFWWFLALIFMFLPWFLCFINLNSSSTQLCKELNMPTV